jgi:hypothetical protein
MLSEGEKKEKEEKKGRNGKKKVREGEKKGRKRKGKPGKGEYEDSVGVEWGDFFFSKSRGRTQTRKKLPHTTAFLLSLFTAQDTPSQPIL